jgi:hypothetical protein
VTDLSTGNRYFEHVSVKGPGKSATGWYLYFLVSARVRLLFLERARNYESQRQLIGRQTPRGYFYILGRAAIAAAVRLIPTPRVTRTRRARRGSRGHARARADAKSQRPKARPLIGSLDHERFSGK